jgi:hypothetical protein
MSNPSPNALDRFVRKTRELFAAESDPEIRWTALTPALAELLADPDVVTASKRWPQCVSRDGRAENLIFYEDPDYGFVVNGLVVDDPSKTRGRIHDHAHIYTLYGVLDGKQHIERYERIDDGSVPDHAEIRRTTDTLAGPGEIDLVRPYEVHSEVSVGERAVAIIVRSQKPGTFNHGRYEPDRNYYYESLGPRLTPLDMFGPSAAPPARAR